MFLSALIGINASNSYCVFIGEIGSKSTPIIIIFVSVLALITYVLVPITKREAIDKLFKNLIEFDSKVAEFNVTIDYKRFTKRSHIYAIAIYGYIPVLMLGLAISHNFEYPPICVSIFYFRSTLLLIINGNLCQFGTEVMSMIKIRMHHLNKLLEKLVRKRHMSVSTTETSSTFQRPGLHLLNMICALHHHLNKTVRVFNDAFGIVLLAFFGAGFVYTVVGFYVFCRMLKIQTTTFEMYLLIVVSIPFIAAILTLCTVGEMTIKEAKKSGQLIHQIETSDYDIKDEIEMFSLQIANEQVEFNAAGFFPINYSLLFSIFSGVTTYIIILIQLSSTE